MRRSPNLFDSHMQIWASLNACNVTRHLTFGLHVMLQDILSRHRSLTNDLIKNAMRMIVYVCVSSFVQFQSKWHLPSTDKRNLRTNKKITRNQAWSEIECEIEYIRGIFDFLVSTGMFSQISREIEWDSDPNFYAGRIEIFRFFP
jgi:hypothetical protein